MCFQLNWCVCYLYVNLSTDVMTKLLPLESFCSGEHDDTRLYPPGRNPNFHHALLEWLSPPELCDTLSCSLFVLLEQCRDWSSHSLKMNPRHKHPWQSWSFWLCNGDRTCHCHEPDGPTSHQSWHQHGRLIHLTSTLASSPPPSCVGICYRIGFWKHH